MQLVHLEANISGSLTSLPPDQSLDLMKILSHDLRGSLVSMSALLDVLSGGCHENKNIVETKLVELIGKMDGLSSMLEESLQMVLALEEADRHEQVLLNLEYDVMEPVISEFAPEIRDRHIAIENRAETVTKFPVKASATVLTMIVRNLMDNAIRHTEVGGTVTVNAKYDGPFCLLRIRSGKSPIAGKLRNGLFPGSEGSLDRKMKSPHEIDLELYLAKRIIQTQGGEIWYEPGEEETGFVLAIPADTGCKRYTSYSQGRLFS